MTSEQKAIYILSQLVCAFAEIEAMKAENMSRKMKGEALAYGEENFYSVIDKYGIHHNGIISFFQE